MPMLNSEMLRTGVQITQPALQRRAFINGNPPCQCKARVDDTSASACHPHGLLPALHLEFFVSKRAGQCMTPMVLNLNLLKRACRPQISLDPAEFALEHF